LWKERNWQYGLEGMSMQTKQGGFTDGNGPTRRFQKKEEKGGGGRNSAASACPLENGGAEGQAMGSVGKIKSALGFGIALGNRSKTTKNWCRCKIQRKKGGGIPTGKKG